MIGYELNGLTLYYVLPNGSKVSANPTDGERYLKLLETMNAQQKAIGDNKVKSDKYGHNLADWQTEYDAGIALYRNLTIPPPVKPKMTVVTDEGESHDVDFVPALADYKPVENITPAHGIGSEARTPQPPDAAGTSNAILLATLYALMNKIDQLANKVNSLSGSK